MMFEMLMRGRKEEEEGERERVKRKEIREGRGRRGGGILAGKSPWTEEPGMLQTGPHKESVTTKMTVHGIWRFHQ